MPDIWASKSLVPSLEYYELKKHHCITGVSHGEPASAVVLQLEVLVSKLLTIDGSETHKTNIIILCSKTIGGPLTYFTHRYVHNQTGRTFY